MAFTVEIDFGNGAGYQDVTHKVASRKVKKKTVLHSDLKSAVNTCTLEIVDPAPEVALLLSYNGKKPIRILSDGTPFFKGYIRDTYKTATLPSPKMEALKIQAVDPSFILEQKVKTAQVLINGQVSNPATPTTSIIHTLLLDAGFSAGEINAAAVSKTVPYFVVEPGETTYKTLISGLLYEFGLCFNFADDGRFELIDLFPVGVEETTYIFGNTDSVNNIAEKLEVEKVEEKKEAVSVGWSTLKEIANTVVFSDTTGGNDFYPCLISVASGDYYPEGAEDRTVFCEYKLQDQDIVIVKSPSLVTALGAGLTVEEFTGYGKRASLRIRNAGGYSATITKLQIKGTAVVVKEANRTEQWNVTDTEKILDYESKYIHNQADATYLVNGLAAYYEYSDFKYKLKSKSNYKAGDIVAIQDDTSGIITFGRIIEKTDDLNGVYSYILEGVYDFTASPVQNESVLHSEPPINYVPSIEDVVEAIDEGYENPAAGTDPNAGTMIPTAVTVEAISSVKAIFLRWSAQNNLRWLDHYQIQVSDDQVSWYEPKTDGTDWKGLINVPADVHNTYFLHENIPATGTEADPQNRTLYYRVRQVTRAGVTGAWSDVAAGTTNLIGAVDILAGSITVDKLQAMILSALMANIKDTLIIDADDGYTARKNGEFRAALREDRIAIEQWRNGQWKLITGFNASGRLTPGAHLRVEETVGVIDVPEFLGTGVNDLSIVRDGDTPCTIEVEIVSVPTYLVGETGPAGGKILAVMSDPHKYVEVWGYDEANTEDLFPFCDDGEGTDISSAAYDSGYENTYNHFSTSNYVAATLARNATHGGYTDWFILDTSIFSLVAPQMHLAGINSGFYWTSTTQQDDPKFVVMAQFDVDGNPLEFVYSNYAFNGRLRVARQFSEIATFRWRVDGGAWSSETPIQYSTPMALANGIEVLFSEAGHVTGDLWIITQEPTKAVSIKDVYGNEYFSCHDGVISSKGDHEVEGLLSAKGGVVDANGDPIEPYTHPGKAWVNKSNLANAAVISNLTIDSLGHPTNWTTRNLTAANIGAAASSHTHAYAGYYTGTTAGASSLPVGSLVFTASGSGSPNQTYSVYFAGLASGYTTSYSSSHTLLAGTWRCRGQNLYQRVA